MAVGLEARMAEVLEVVLEAADAVGLEASMAEVLEVVLEAVAVGLEARMAEVLEVVLEAVVVAVAVDVVVVVLEAADAGGLEAVGLPKNPSSANFLWRGRASGETNVSFRTTCSLGSVTMRAPMARIKRERHKTVPCWTKFNARSGASTSSEPSLSKLMWMVVASSTSWS